MRITGGILCGRRFEAPPKGIRPTQDKVRSALFSILGTRVVGRNFLDLYAGSGGVGLEAWSRGAAQTVWVEKDMLIARILRRNIESLCDNCASVLVTDVCDFLQRKKAGDSFKIVFCDPPYEATEERDVVVRLLSSLGKSGTVADDGIVVIECRAKMNLSTLTGWGLFEERVYGDTKLAFWDGSLLRKRSREQRENK